jgi:hypothetical protein
VLHYIAKLVVASQQLFLAKKETMHPLTSASRKVDSGVVVSGVHDP